MLHCVAKEYAAHALQRPRSKSQHHVLIWKCNVTKDMMWRCMAERHAAHALQKPAAVKKQYQACQAAAGVIISVIISLIISWNSHGRLTLTAIRQSPLSLYMACDLACESACHVSQHGQLEEADLRGARSHGGEAAG